jgi:hypothetical protein
MYSNQLMRSEDMAKSLLIPLILGAYSKSKLQCSERFFGGGETLANSHGSFSIQASSGVLYICLYNGKGRVGPRDGMRRKDEAVFRNHRRPFGHRNAVLVAAKCDAQDIHDGEHEWDHVDTALEDSSARYNRPLIEERLFASIYSRFIPCGV